MDVTRRTLVKGGIAMILATLMDGSFASNSRLSVVELRQYTLHRNRRDEFIDLFERRFIEPQERLGIVILGTFRDLDDPDRFVWIRGFRDMTARKVALEQFYGGPIWKEHRDAANATMLDSDNVLLLAPLEGSQLLISPRQSEDKSITRISIHYLKEVSASDFAKFFIGAMQPNIVRAGAKPSGTLVSETTPNNFRLPVRENDPVFAWLTRHASVESERLFTERLHQLSGWRDDALDSVLPAVMTKPEVLRLMPTPNTRSTIVEHPNGNRR